MIGRLCIAYLRWRGLQVSGANTNTSYFYDEEGLKTSHNHDFIDDPRFTRAIEASWSGEKERRYGTHGRWNFHVSIWAASHAIAIGGDIVQLGVFSGSEASAIASFTDFGTKSQRMFLVDTFTGVPEEQWTKSEIAAGANSAQWAYKESGDLFPLVRQRFAAYQNIEVIQGKVPDALALIKTEKIGLLMLDMNCAAPERAAANYLWNKILPGGLILSDDYGHSRPGQGYYEQKLAFDEFAKLKGLPVLTIPTGHGMLIKAKNSP